MRNLHQHPFGVGLTLTEVLGRLELREHRGVIVRFGRVLAVRRAVADVELAVVREVRMECESEQPALVVASQLRDTEVNDLIADIEEWLVLEPVPPEDVDLTGLIQDKPSVGIFGSDLEPERMRQSVGDLLELNRSTLRNF